VIVIVAGVAGSGKTTIGMQLAERLGWRFADADSFHPAANVAKMRQGIPLTDKDRAPWLRRIGAWMDDVAAEGQSGVVTCSALRLVYRQELLFGRPTTRMVFLQVSREQLVRRLARRPGHFFPEGLLDSQLAALEPPAAGEHILTIWEHDDAPHTVTEIITRLGLDGGGGQGGRPQATA
jgi:gluconokinase